MHLQKTFNKPVQFSGVGVHSGSSSSVTIVPGPSGSGIMFRNVHSAHEFIRIGSIVPESAMHATVLRGGQWFISTVEHLMAAMLMLGIDDAVIEVDGGEIPILDGSAMVFAQGFIDAGLSQTTVYRRFITPRERIAFSDQQGRVIEVIPAQKDCFDLVIEYVADFHHPRAGKPYLQATMTAEFFLEHIAPARTFGFLEQLPFLRQHNLARGSSLSNTVVIGQDEINGMRFSDECVRHKVLDLIGDLSLLGCPLIGTVKAYKTSHNFNRVVIDHFIQNPDQWVYVG